VTDAEAKSIGGRQGLIAAATGIIIAYTIMVYMFSADYSLSAALFWFANVEYKLNLLIGVALMLLVAYLFGRAAGRAIIVKKYNAALVGIICGVAVLVTTAFLCGWTGFFREGIRSIGTGDDPLQDYVFKPLYWVTIFGFIPAVLVGVAFGIRVQRRGSVVESE
jgi:hypothetical protein